jgi:hypothetical protein
MTTGMGRPCKRSFFMNRGDPVTILNAAGDRVALGGLNRGERWGTGDMNWCRFNFTVAGVPSGEPVYTAKIGGIGRDFPEGDAEGVYLTTMP